MSGVSISVAQYNLVQRQKQKRVCILLVTDSVKTLLQSYPYGLQLVLSLQSKRINKECICIWEQLYKTTGGKNIVKICILY